MSLDKYIPAGRTSLVKKGEFDLQVQTEYAYRPHPRITTSISASGRVVQKIERTLSKPIESEEEQVKVQRTIVQQHAEVIKLISKRSAKKSETVSPEEHQPKIDHRIVPDSGSDAQVQVAHSEPAPQATAIAEPVAPEPAYRNIPERLMELQGVCQVYRLTNDGDFIDATSAIQFRKQYKKIFKNLADLMELYGREEGGIKRSIGVYEVQPEKLYFASSGIECYFIVIDKPSFELSYEFSIRDIIVS